MSTAPAKRVQWNIISSGGSFLCRVPGFDLQVIELKSGMNEITLPVNGNVSQFEVVSLPPKTFAVFDAQRCYNRSTLNGSPLQGEWLSRFFSR
jgi:hypothetical protein